MGEEKLITNKKAFEKTQKQIKIFNIMILLFFSRVKFGMKKFLGGEKMQSAKELELFTKCNGAGSFTLTKLWIEKAEDVELSATAVSVMTALLWHYNPAKKYVFPHQETIAKRIKRSIATVKRAIAELKQAGFIISSRTRNGNLYAFTKKFFELFETSESPICTEQKDKNELCMNKEHVKEQKNNNVVVSFKVSKEEIPLCLKRRADKGEIENIGGYWRSLSKSAKEFYFNQDKKELEAEKRKAELKKQRELREAQEKEEKRKLHEELTKPITEQMTREGAIQQVKTLYKTFGQKVLTFPRTAEIVRSFGISEEELRSLNECLRNV